MCLATIMYYAGPEPSKRKRQRSQAAIQKLQEALDRVQYLKEEKGRHPPTSREQLHEAKAKIFQFQLQEDIMMSSIVMFHRVMQMVDRLFRFLLMVLLRMADEVFLPHKQIRQFRYYLNELLCRPSSFESRSVGLGLPQQTLQTVYLASLTFLLTHYSL